MITKSAAISSVIVGILAIAGLFIRILNPELTETQLFINYWYFWTGMAVICVLAGIWMKNDKSPDPCRINKWQWHEFPKVKPPLEKPLVVLMKYGCEYPLVGIACALSSIVGIYFVYFVLDVPTSTKNNVKYNSNDIEYWMELPELPKE